MSNTGIVQDYKKSESGRTKVKIDGQWYNAGNGVDIGPSTVSVGTRISFDSSSKDWNGKSVWWLNKYGALPASSNGVHADPAPRGLGPVIKAGAPNDPNMHPEAWSPRPYATPAASPQPPTSSMTEGERLCVSNWLGHALSAGTIKSPDELDIWVKASLAAIRGTTRQPGEDDEF